MSFYNLVLRAQANNNVLENAFQYETGSLLPSNEEAGDLINKFVADTFPKIRVLAHSVTIYERCYVTAPFTPDVFALGLFPPGTAGTAAGEAMPRFNAWGFICPRRRRDIANGGKRFGVVAEGQQTGGLPVAGALTLLNALAAQMNLALALDWGTGSSAAQPIIVKRIKYTTPKGKTAYRLPTGTDPYEFYAADRWAFDELTTQNSRKTGRGS